MNRIYKKTNVIKTYGLILIELIAVMAAVLIAVYTRFGGLGAEGNLEIYIQFGIHIHIFYKLIKHQIFYSSCFTFIIKH